MKQSFSEPSSCFCRTYVQKPSIRQGSSEQESHSIKTTRNTSTGKPTATVVIRHFVSSFPEFQLLQLSLIQSPRKWPLTLVASRSPSLKSLSLDLTSFNTLLAGWTLLILIAIAVSIHFTHTCLDSIQAMSATVRLFLQRSAWFASRAPERAGGTLSPWGRRRRSRSLRVCPGACN